MKTLLLLRKQISKRLDFGRISYRSQPVNLNTRKVPEPQESISAAVLNLLMIQFIGA